MFSISTTTGGFCFLFSASCAPSPSSEYDCYYLPDYEAPATAANVCTHKLSKSTNSIAISACKAISDEKACSQSSDCDWVYPAYSTPSTAVSTCTHTSEKGSDLAKVLECRSHSDAAACNSIDGCLYNYAVCEHFTASPAHVFYEDQATTAAPG